MTTSEELVVAQTISNVSLWGIGRELRQPVLHDDGSRSGMFDIEFPDTDPPAAMEVTAIVDDYFVKTADAAQKAVDRELTKIAEESGHPLGWVFHIQAGTILRELRPQMVEIVRSGIPPIRRNIVPGLNKVDVEPSEHPTVAIATWSSTRAGLISGFGPELERAVAENRAKLAAATGYERHLAVDIVGLRASDSSQTYTPELPDEIDYLWVTRRWISSVPTSPVVWVTDGEGTWKVNGEPHEAM